jgi:hypothetical protein
MGLWSKLFGSSKKQYNDAENIIPSPEEILLRDFLQTSAHMTVLPNDPPSVSEEAAYGLKLAAHDFAGENQSNNSSNWLGSSDFSGFKNSDSD